MLVYVSGKKMGEKYKIFCSPDGHKVRSWKAVENYLAGGPGSATSGAKTTNGASTTKAEGRPTKKKKDKALAAGQLVNGVESVGGRQHQEKERDFVYRSQQVVSTSGKRVHCCCLDANEP